MDFLGKLRYRKIRGLDSYLSLCGSFPLKETQRIRVLQPQWDEPDICFGKVLLLETIHGALFVSLRGFNRRDA